MLTMNTSQESRSYGQMVNVQAPFLLTQGGPASPGKHSISRPYVGKNHPTTTINFECPITPASTPSGFRPAKSRHPSCKRSVNRALRSFALASFRVSRSRRRGVSEANRKQSRATALQLLPKVHHPAHFQPFQIPIPSLRYFITSRRPSLQSFQMGEVK